MPKSGLLNTMKFKLGEKFVCIKYYKNEDIELEKDTVFKLGEYCLQGNSNMLELFGEEYVIDIPDEMFEQISQCMIPLSLYRQQRIDEIFE